LDKPPAAALTPNGPAKPAFEGPAAVEREP
jgi:hypothetical protein